MGSPIRVLHVVVNMNRGGAETLIMNLYRNIDRSKIQFDFLTCKEGVFDQEIKGLGGKIHRIPYITDGGHFHYIMNLNQFFRENIQYKIVHSHMDKMSGFVLKSAKKAGIPVRIAHSHNTESEGGLVSKFYKSYAGSFIKNSTTHFLACSSEAAKWLFSDEANEASILKNGIDTNDFGFSLETRKQVRKELNIGADVFVVGHIGRFCEQKNHTFIINIFSHIQKIHPNSILILAGDGPLFKNIQKRVKESNFADKVKFVGVHSKINQLLQSFDVFLFPSLHEGFGIVTLEAQGTGLPCLISDVIPKEVDMKVGLVNYESLNTPADIWAEKLISINNGLIDAKESIKKNGYDIRDSVVWLENFYIYLYQKNETDNVFSKNNSNYRGVGNV